MNSKYCGRCGATMQSGYCPSCGETKVTNLSHFIILLNILIMIPILSASPAKNTKNMIITLVAIAVLTIIITAIYAKKMDKAAGGTFGGIIPILITMNILVTLGTKILLNRHMYHFSLSAHYSAIGCIIVIIIGLSLFCYTSTRYVNYAKRKTSDFFSQLIYFALEFGSAILATIVPLLMKAHQYSIDKNLLKPAIFGIIVFLILWISVGDSSRFGHDSPQKAFPTCSFILAVVFNFFVMTTSGYTVMRLATDFQTGILSQYLLELLSGKSLVIIFLMLGVCAAVSTLALPDFYSSYDPGATYKICYSSRRAGIDTMILTNLACLVLFLRYILVYDRWSGLVALMIFFFFGQYYFKKEVNGELLSRVNNAWKLVLIALFELFALYFFYSRYIITVVIALVGIYLLRTLFYRKGMLSRVFTLLLTTVTVLSVMIQASIYTAIVPYLGILVLCLVMIQFLQTSPGRHRETLQNMVGIIFILLSVITVFHL